MDPTRLELDLEAGAVLSQIDGDTSVSDLSLLTGVAEDQVRTILDQLVSSGAIEAQPAQSTENGVLPARQMGQTSILPDLSAAPPPKDEPPPSDPYPVETPDADTTSDPNQATHRKLYETELKLLERDVRVSLAENASDPVLGALCFDPEPAVVLAVVRNHSVGLAHARLIAAHHRTQAGLDALARRTHFLRDAAVRRFLLRNMQTPDSVLRRLFSPLPLIQIFKIPMGRESTERGKRIAREVLRQKFQRADGEERAGLVFNTEGRCLTQLIGLHFDSKTTLLLCRRTYNSAILIQSLARFAGTPPKLIEHLLKQAVVRRQVHLRNLLKRHSNCPASLKK